MMIERCKNDGQTRDEWWMYTIYAHSLLKKMLWEVLISNNMLWQIGEMKNSSNV
jgi:hypothetical protein